MSIKKTAQLIDYQLIMPFYCGGGRTRTYDLWVMLTTTVFTASEHFGICSLDFLFILLEKTRLGCLPLSLYTFSDSYRNLARDYHTTGFPEFDRLSPRNFFRGSPM